MLWGFAGSLFSHLGTTISEANALASEHGNAGATDAL
jgi:hypothetical protein